MLYRAIDAANDGLISREDFKHFMLHDDISRSRLVSEELVLHDFAKAKQTLELTAPETKVRGAGIDIKLPSPEEKETEAQSVKDKVNETLIIEEAGEKEKREKEGDEEEQFLGLALEKEM